MATEMQKATAGQAGAAESGLKERSAAQDTSKMLAQFGGFAAIKSFLPDADNLNPARKANKAIFLTDKRFEGKREALARDIKGWLDLLDQEGMETVSDYADYCEEQEQQTTDLLRENIQTAMEATEKIERTYRALDSFFRNASLDGKVHNLRLVNVNKDDIADPNSHFDNEVDELLRQGYDRLSLKDSYSIMCIPGFVFQDKPTLLHWAQIAHKYKVMMVTDHEDNTSFESMQEYTADYKDSDAALMNVVMTANWIKGREADPLFRPAFEDEDGAFYVYPAGALAGKLYDETANMAQGAGGKKHGTLDGVKGVRVNLLKSEIGQLMDNQVVPMVISEGRVMAFNNTTLYNGDLRDMREYPIVRVFDWVKKVLMNYVHEVALENWDKYNSPAELKARIQKFLNRHKGYGKLFQDYEIQTPTFDKETNRVTCDITLVPFNAAKNFVIKVGADKKNKDLSMDAVDK